MIKRLRDTWAVLIGRKIVCAHVRAHVQFGSVYSGGGGGAVSGNFSAGGGGGGASFSGGGAGG